MMTEENHWPDEGYLHIPTGSLWIAEPSFAREVSAEEWAYAADWLRDLMPIAGYVNEALTIALGDTQRRCWQEHRWADEREATPESERNHFGLSPGEDERLRDLLRRSDAVNNAYTFVLDYAPEDSNTKAATLEWLEVLGKEMHQQFQQYKRELGMPKPGRPE